jgi:predicted N-acetyltransferase YhbS
VRRESQRKGVGSALTQARIDLLTRNRRRLAVVLAMFWNVKFFRRLGFQSVRRDLLPARVQALADFRNPLYKHSAILWQQVP